MSKTENTCLRIAHRGASGHAVENTAPALKKAIKQKADMVEMDVRQCASGELVLFHDASLERLTSTRQLVADVTLVELWHIFPEALTLRVALDILRGRTQAYIEIKDKGTARDIMEIIREYVAKRGWREEDILIASHYAGELEEALRVYPKIRRILIVNSSSMGRVQHLIRWPYKKWRLARELEVSALSFSKWLLRKKYVRQAHERGYKVLVWTVNRRKNIDRMKKWGVDGIISNYPERI